VTDYIKNMNCKEKDSFCYTCCENEFGDMYMKDREKCYKMCDNKGKTKIKKRWKGTLDMEAKRGKNKE